MRVVKPPRLKKGSVIGVVSPSYTITEVANDYASGIKNLRGLGFEIKEGTTTRVGEGRMPGSDEERAKDINAMFADSDVKGIVCALGGRYGLRTLRYLDWKLIGSNPKVFSGMSDITTFHAALLAKTGLSGLHQTDVVFGFGQDPRSQGWKFETSLFQRITGESKPLGSLPSLTPWACWRGGRAEGRLFGGHLPTLRNLMGTRYFPEIDERIIFFFEAMSNFFNEIETILVQFREAGVLDKTAGLLVGKIRGEKDGNTVDMTTDLKEIVMEITDEYDVPVIAGMDFGHYTPNLPMPLGIRAEINADLQDVRIIESYVK